MRFLFAAVALVFVGACAKPATSYNPKIEPSRFTTKITNPFFPLVPGTTFHYEGTADGEKTIGDVVVTRQTIHIQGIPVVLVHDVDRNGDGHVIEDTIDYYSQDDAGNVWYIGEETVSYEDGVANHRGTWRYGSNGAKPGIAMKAHPKQGERYRQEFRRGHAEDEARVVRVTDDTIVTQEFTRLEPGVIEEKTYELGRGLVRLRSVKGEHEESRLVSVKRP